MARAFALFVLVGLILLVGFLGYEFFTVSTQNNQLKAANGSLQQKIDKLNQQLSGKTSGTTGTTSNASSSSFASKTCTATAVPQSEQDTLASAISAQDYNSVKAYMADQVNVVIAGQEKGGDESAADATIDLTYLNAATAPWNFKLPSTTTDVWRAHTFKQYFTGVYIAGESTDNEVISLQFDGCNKVSGIFMANDVTLLDE